MTLNWATDNVWQELEKSPYAVIGTVTAKNQARTIGTVYIVRDRKLYIAAACNLWKTKHREQNPRISVTVPIPMRNPLVSWVKIPAATITFYGRARTCAPAEMPEDLLSALFPGPKMDDEEMANSCIIEISPEKEFVTY